MMVAAMAVMAATAFADAGGVRGHHTGGDFSSCETGSCDVTSTDAGGGRGGGGLHQGEVVYSEQPSQFVVTDNFRGGGGSSGGGSGGNCTTTVDRVTVNTDTTGNGSACP
jgi:hypothetical protein